jgi:hypothetical protein
VNTDLVNKLAEQAGGTYTVRNVITTRENGLPIEMMERFARLVVLECANLFEDDGAMSSMAEHVHNNRVRNTILDHFGVEP